MQLFSTRRTRRALYGAVAITALAAAACNSDDTNNPTLTATSIVANTGVDGQSSPVGQATTTGASVIVKDQNGDLLPNAPVTWTVVSGGGTLSATSSTTNASGVADIGWTLGTTAGANSIQAALANGTSVTINATGIAGSAAALNVVSGNNQTVTSGTSTAAMVVKVVDQYGNAVSGVTINWTTTGGTLSGATSTTDSNGQASITLMTGATPGGYTVTGTSGTMSTTFTATGN